MKTMIPTIQFLYIDPLKQGLKQLHYVLGQ